MLFFSYNFVYFRLKIEENAYVKERGGGTLITVQYQISAKLTVFFLYKTQKVFPFYSLQHSTFSTSLFQVDLTHFPREFPKYFFILWRHYVLTNILITFS